MKLLFTPVSVIAGVLAGLVGLRVRGPGRLTAARGLGCLDCGDYGALTAKVPKITSPFWGPST
jgi:hypothetical protein